MRSLFKIMFLFVAFTVLPSMNGVFAASFQTSGFVTLIGDETKKDWADIRIEYTFPDRVNSGDRFDVDVTLTYVKNDNAKIAYLEFFDVKVSVRNPDDKAIVTISKSDVSRRRAAPGERYTGRLSIDAPSQAGEYLVVLMWMTYNPEAEAYGEKMKAGELVWNISEWRDTPKARLVVQKLTAILELVSKSFTPKEGESIYSGDIVTARYELRNTGTASARAVKIIAETQKDVFTVEATPAKDIAPGGTELFILKLRFDKEGSYNVKVQLFSGDTLVQEAPLTVQISPKPSSNYLIIGGGAIAIVAVAAVAMIMMKRKRAPAAEVMQIPTIPSPPPQAPLRAEPKAAQMETEAPAPAGGVKYCVHCGAIIPDVVTFCTKCGKKQ